MKIPLSWISLYTPLDTILRDNNIKSLAHEYSIHTAEIDGIEHHTIDKVVVGKVLSTEKHPESKKLSIVRVFLGYLGEETILTGAANIAEATYVPVAVVGAVLPGDFTIGERMMAGMMSRGMICGADEIGMSTEESTGIMILEEHWDREHLESFVGRSFFDLTLPFPGKNGELYHYPIGGTTFEIDNKFITNRPDLFSVVGNAREFATVFSGILTPYEHKEVTHNDALLVSIESDRVRAFHMRAMDISGVGKSPFGISLIMERAGLSPKMDIVDVTNLIMTELGQPMHAFDAEKIEGTIRVRMAEAGETLLALNGVEYTLTPDDLIIADDRGPLSLAGIIGGARSAVSETTKKVIWESGNFDPTSIRLSTQRHGIRTDASTRFEKSLDPLLAETVFSRVMEYLDFLGKGAVLTGSYRYIDEGKVQHITIELSVGFLSDRAGKRIERSEAVAILDALGFKVGGEGDTLVVSVPSARATKDISIKEDIAEEVIRVIGYESIPALPLPIGQSILKKNLDRRVRDLLLSFFQKHGWNEVYTYSFTNASLDAKIGLENMESAIGIQNAFNQEYTHMRRSLAPRIFESVAENLKHRSEISFFEVGKIYGKEISTGSNPLLSSIEPKPFPEKKMLAGATTHLTIESLRSLLDRLCIEILGYTPPIHSSIGPSFLHPGVRGSYSIGEDRVIEFGLIHPAVAEGFTLPENTLYFQADFALLLELYADRDTRFHPISRYQTVPRELNFLVPKTTPTGDIAKILDSVHPWIQNVIVASVYEDDEKLGKENKSVNFSFVLSNLDGTISDSEALHVQNLAIETMQSHGYPLRMI